MKTKITSLLALLLGISAPAALAQTTPPVLICNIVNIGISDGTLANTLIFSSFGSNYTANPNVTLTGGGGTGASITAVESGGSVSSFIVTPGMNYIGAPTVTFSGGEAPAAVTAPTQAAATAELNFPASQVFNAPFQNEVYGQAGRTIEVNALASGTQPAEFSYSFTSNGLNIGSSMGEPPGTTGEIVWTPPLPGVYSLQATTTDGFGNTGVSSEVRYFAIGTAIVSSEASSFPPGNPGQNGVGPGILVPIGSSLVIQATSTAADGFVSRIDFYTDWTGLPGSTVPAGTLIGSETNYPYSVIYTPAGPAGVSHTIKAIGYDNLGNPIPTASNGMDQLNLTMAAANPNPLPSCVIITPANNALIPIPDYVTSTSANIPVIVTAGAGTAQAGAIITEVQLYINGILFATDTAYPYTFSWQPSVTGTYQLTALAYDNLGNVVASTSGAVGTALPTTVTVQALPSVAILSPAGGGTINAGAPTAITAVASDTNFNSSGSPATIQEVQFFQDGNFVGEATTPDKGSADQYTVTFDPVQKEVNGEAVASAIYVTATDTLGYTGTSPSISVNVTSGGTGTSVVIGTPPTVSLLTPANNASVVVNTPTTLSVTANAPNGNIASVTFLIDDKVLSTITQYPYTAAWTPANLGFYTVTATVTDNVGDKTNSSAITVNVVPEPPPTVSVTSPSSGGIITVGQSVTVTANATSPSGTISSVQFYENGILIGTSTASPYTETFTPTSTGVYTFTAIATDNSGETNQSTSSIVEVVPATAGVGTVEYFGQYLGINGGGNFAFSVVDGTLGTFIGYPTSGPAAALYYPDLAVSSSGGFNLAKVTNGNASSTGVSGTLLANGDQYIGTITQAGSVAVGSGFYSGNLGGVATSQVTAIVGQDGEIMVYIAEGTFSDAGSSEVDSSGDFTITTVANNTITGTVNPSTGFMTGSLTGGPGGSIFAARVSGGTFSDGVLKNLSTRGQVGSGAADMIAGFVVGGSVPKQLLVRAVGPTLKALGITSAVAATQLAIYSGTTQIAANTGWSSTPANATTVTAADSQVGAFALPTGSADSALVYSFAPGAYSAEVSGVGSDTGIGLVEVYDMDSVAPFTTQKLVNLSTRGNVGTGTSVMIGGFIISGSAPKRLLIRGAGPGLTKLGVSGALATPHLQLYDGAGALVRENFTWQTGNDPGLVSAAEAATGAFLFANGSADSAILIVVPPGTYSAVLSGTGTSTGNALIEVYEVP
jgi:hypothetical protein